MLVRSKRNPLLSRTSPNIYDIIAFFWLVGAIAITRVEGNPIPGVAIATALCLLCAGYGLALGSYKFFFGPCICIP
jgi:uncharacterized membrane protein